MGIEALAEARRIEAYGIASSAPIAVDAYYRFLRIGLPVAVVTNSHVEAVSASLLLKGDVGRSDGHRPHLVPAIANHQGCARRTGHGIRGDGV